MPRARSAPVQLALPWVDLVPPATQTCRRCGRRLRAPLARRYGLGEVCHIRALSEHERADEQVDLVAELRAAVAAARAAEPAASVHYLPRRPDRPAG